MRVSPSSLPPTIFETFSRPSSKPRFLKPSILRPIASSNPFTTSQTRRMSSSPDFAKHGIETTSFNPNPGVSLSAGQQLATGCVLDLFAGRPSKRKLLLWDENASFHDPLTNAVGRKQYEAQWYGLKAAFSEIERLQVSVKSAGNPIELDLKTR